MSSFSTPHSPPETPLKPAMAVDKENVTPKTRPLQTPSRSSVPEITAKSPLKTAAQQSKTRPFELPSRSGIQEPAVGTPSKASQQPLQVPSTLPQDDHEDDPVIKEVPPPEQIHSDASDAPTEEAEDDQQAERDTPPSSNPDGPLQPMDWDEFEGRYRNAMQKANDEEDALLAEFDKYVEVGQSSIMLVFNANGSSRHSHFGLQLQLSVTMREVGSGEYPGQVSLDLTDVFQVENSTTLCPAGREQVEGKARSL
jgi:hypothetical protein